MSVHRRKRNKKEEVVPSETSMGESHVEKEREDITVDDMSQALEEAMGAKASDEDIVRMYHKVFVELDANDNLKVVDFENTPRRDLLVKWISNVLADKEDCFRKLSTPTLERLKKHLEV